MSGESSKGAGKDQDQMSDQGAFREDPRGKQEVSGQQPETEPGGEGAARPGRADDEGDQRSETGRDDAGEATGNPPNAG